MALDIIRVDSPRKAAAILDSEPGARFLGGGTLIVRAVNTGSGEIDKLVLSDGLGLDGISVESGSVTLGAAVTMNTLARDKRLDFLRPVAESIGGPPVRAMATVAGNIFAPYPYGDFAVALIALGAKATIQHPDKTETTAVEDLVRIPAATAGVVVSVSFPLPSRDAFRFTKVVRRHPHGASILSIAALLPITGGKIANARVAYGAMAPTPIRATAVERALEGRALDAAAIDAAGKVATEGCAPLTDPQASDWYRLNVLAVHLRRLLGGQEYGEA